MQVAVTSPGVETKEPRKERRRRATDRTQPSGPWSFDAEVTECFDDMLARSIPQYGAMREASFALGQRYVQPGTCVVDLGCSRGAALAPYVALFGDACRYVGVEASAPMADACRQRFAREITAGVVTIEEIDLREAYPDQTPSLTLSILTAQFVPIERRQRLMRCVYEHTLRGGALILVEKVLGSTAAIDDELVSRYYDIKEANGYSREAIARKRASLEGVLVPLTAQWNEDLLRGAGFRQIDCFWRYLNFAGWIAVKDGAR
jgi:tRNA (cmo5U34)-methyltransferase